MISLQTLMRQGSSSKYPTSPPTNHPMNLSTDEYRESYFGRSYTKHETTLRTVILRIVAALGVILLLERAVSYYRYSQYDAYLTSATANAIPGLREYHYSSDPTNGTNVHQDSTTIVVASIKSENTSWVHEYLPHWGKAIYVLDDPSAEYSVFKNKGREATAFLTYIINHYDELPDFVVFHHAERYQWHNDDPMYDTVPLLTSLRLPHVSQEGYVSLRCTWEPGCSEGLRPDIEIEDGFFGIQSLYAKVWAKFFKKVKVPKMVKSGCCAQFAVTRKTVRAKPKRHYQMILNWMLHNDIGNDQRTGRILEYQWHIIFGKKPVNCPSAKECFCRTYGLCDLDCPTDAECKGRWHMTPPFSDMPKNWPDEGPGEGGWPERNWWLHDEA